MYFSTILLTMDVASLYTSIPHEEISTSHSFLLDLLDLHLEEKSFKFGDNYFFLKGMAMGYTRAPNIANVFMTALEEIFIYSFTNTCFLSSIVI